jgi:hypothetical protein
MNMSVDRSLLPCALWQSDEDCPKNLAPKPAAPDEETRDDAPPAAAAATAASQTVTEAPARWHWGSTLDSRSSAGPSGSLIHANASAVIAHTEYTEATEATDSMRIGPAAQYQLMWLHGVNAPTHRAALGGQLALGHSSGTGRSALLDAQLMWNVEFADKRPLSIGPVAQVNALFTQSLSGEVHGPAMHLGLQFDGQVLGAHGDIRGWQQTTVTGGIDLPMGRHFNLSLGLAGGLASSAGNGTQAFGAAQGRVTFEPVPGMRLAGAVNQTFISDHQASQAPGPMARSGISSELGLTGQFVVELNHL